MCHYSTGGGVKMATFHMQLRATAFVEGSLDVEAEDEERAYKEALDQLGNVLWHYDGVKHDTVILVGIKEER